MNDHIFENLILLILCRCYGNYRKPSLSEKPRRLKFVIVFSYIFVNETKKKKKSSGFLQNLIRKNSRHAAFDNVEGF